MSPGILNSRKLSSVRLTVKNDPAKLTKFAVRMLSAIGLISGASFFLHGVLRFSAEPILYIDSLDHDWGQAAYLAVQMVGIHGFAQAGSFALCAWVVGVSIVGVRAKVVPAALALLAVLPGFRLVGLLIAHFVTLPDATWLIGIAAIPGVMLWCLLLGIVFLRRHATAHAPRRITVARVEAG